MQVVVSGLHVNNTANILGSFQVCNSTVFITDVVLLPADSLQAIPQAPAAATPSRAGETCCLTYPATLLSVRTHRCTVDASILPVINLCWSGWRQAACTANPEVHVILCIAWPVM